MTIHDIPHIAKHLLKKHGLADWSFQWDKARRRIGRCTYYNKTISMSKRYAELNVATNSDHIIDTILHEIAHALAPGDSHGEKWKAACRTIGANPEQYYCENDVVADPRYKAVCPSCGKTYRKFRKTSYMKKSSYKFAYCTLCGADFGRLTWIDTKDQPKETQDTYPLPPPETLR